MTPSAKPFGTWPSPLSASDLGSAGLGFGNLRSANGALYWSEIRPGEGGRTVVMRLAPDGAAHEVTPAGTNARSRVHEYGGTPFVVTGDHVIYAEFSDQHLYEASSSGDLTQLTHEGNLRYADGIHDAGCNRIICVCEDHRPDTLEANGEAKNAIAAIDLTDGSHEILFDGNDFVAYPRLSADGSKLTWIGWNHPNMPWDTVFLYVAAVDSSGALSDIQILNGAESEAVLQPSWSPDGTLYFSADRSGYWSLYRWDGSEVRCVLAREADLGGPLWALGSTYFDFLPDGQIIASYTHEAEQELLHIEPQTGDFKVIDVGRAQLSDPTVVSGQLFALAEYPDKPPALVEVDVQTGTLSLVKKGGDTLLEKGDISIPKRMTFATSNNETSHGIYYPPTNSAYETPEGDLPPVIVMAHGGPTGHKLATFQLDIQFWTTRGFAVFNVNYRGSTGFGRAYRRRLYGDWGIADVEDAVNGARYLAEAGLADPNRLLIRGGSAGGYVVLAAMAFHDVFAAGANYYGVSDMSALAEETHKFESRYTDQLVGPYREMKSVYEERSPINHLDGFSKPLITFQGLEDEIVPPNQSEAIFSALKAKGVPCAYVTFPEEQHGFRKAENRERSLEAELYFYGKVLGFEPSGELSKMEIENL